VVPVFLYGNYLIPASAGLKGVFIIGVCSGAPRECSTRTIYNGLPQKSGR
jgi:hypothetical protein